MADLDAAEAGVDLDVWGTGREGREVEIAEIEGEAAEGVAVAVLGGAAAVLGDSRRSLKALSTLKSASMPTPSAPARMTLRMSPTATQAAVDAAPRLSDQPEADEGEHDGEDDAPGGDVDVDGPEGGRSSRSRSGRPQESGAPLVPAEACGLSPAIPPARACAASSSSSGMMNPGDDVEQDAGAAEEDERRPRRCGSGRDRRRGSCRVHRRRRRPPDRCGTW